MAAPTRKSSMVKIGIGQGSQRSAFIPRIIPIVSLSYTKSNQDQDLCLLWVALNVSQLDMVNPRSLKLLRHLGSIDSRDSLGSLTPPRNKVGTSRGVPERTAGDIVLAYARDDKD